jgi:hypothetical protein
VEPHRPQFAVRLGPDVGMTVNPSEPQCSSLSRLDYEISPMGSCSEVGLQLVVLFWEVLET